MPKSQMTVRHAAVLGSPHLTGLHDDERFFRRCHASMEHDLERLHADGPVEPLFWQPKVFGRLAAKGGRLYPGLVHER